MYLNGRVSQLQCRSVVFSASVARNSVSNILGTIVMHLPSNMVDEKAFSDKLVLLCMS